MTAMDCSVQSYNEYEFRDRIKQLYPEIKDKDLPYPTKWNNKDKYDHISLSQDNLKAEYVGPGKSHKDAASVRANYPIPPRCGIYYFEVTIISKGKDGYMGVGLSAQSVNLNRLPGWDKLSYGYHGDDGHSFCSSGTGQPYGPTFSTGDIIGCCVNTIEGSCFYTKNGVNIGIAFKDLPSIPLYPMIGLQTHREEVSANFGQHSFMFDIEDYIQEWKENVNQNILDQPVNDDSGQFQTVLRKLISSYLIHHGYAATAEAFATCINHNWEEHNGDLSSIRNRQKLQKLVLAGRLNEAITTTKQLFPGLLEKNKSLYFKLKVQQFIEIVNGTESEVNSLTQEKNDSSDINSIKNGGNTSWSLSQNGFSSNNNSSSTLSSMPPPSQPIAHSSSTIPQSSSRTSLESGSSTESDSEMETDSEDQTSKYAENKVISNGDGVELKKINPKTERAISNGVSLSNGVTKSSDIEDTEIESKEQMETENSNNQLCGGNKIAIQQMLSFGHDLLVLGNEIEQQGTSGSLNKRLLEDAFSLLAYSDPKNSPVGYQLETSQREPICKALNSAILESQNLPKSPPLLMAIAHTEQNIKKMSENNIGASAFVSVSDYLL